MTTDEFYNVTKVSITIELIDEADLENLYKIMAELKTIKGLSSYKEDIAVEKRSKKVYCSHIPIELK